jgi:protein required for attachment to host cells
MRPPKEIWVLVADEAIARVLRRPASDGTLEPVHALTDPAAHSRERGFERDALGRRVGGSPARDAARSGHSGFAHPASATASAGESERHLEAEAFARQVAAWLHEALLQKRFDELHIAAAPRFLGLLRKALSKQTAERVVQEIDKDWVQTDDAMLTRRLFPDRRGG